MTRRRREGSHRGGERLTETDRKVMAGVKDGLTNPEIAEALAMTVKSVENRVSVLYAHFDVHNRNRVKLAQEIARRFPDPEASEDEDYLAGIFGEH